MRDHASLKMLREPKTEEVPSCSKSRSFSEEKQTLPRTHHHELRQMQEA